MVAEWPEMPTSTSIKPSDQVLTPWTQDLGTKGKAWRAGGSTTKHVYMCICVSLCVCTHTYIVYIIIIILIIIIYIYIINTYIYIYICVRVQ